jgi:hypothetical protein
VEKIRFEILYGTFMGVLRLEGLGCWQLLLSQNENE